MLGLWGTITMFYITKLSLGCIQKWHLANFEDFWPPPHSIMQKWGVLLSTSYITSQSDNPLPLTSAPSFVILPVSDQNPSFVFEQALGSYDMFKNVAAIMGINSWQGIIQVVQITIVVNRPIKIFNCFYGIFFWIICCKVTWRIKPIFTNSYQDMARRNLKHGLVDLVSVVIKIICNSLFVIIWLCQLLLELCILLNLCQ